MTIGPKPGPGDIVEITRSTFDDGQSLPETWIGLRAEVIRSADLSTGEVYLRPTMDRPDMANGDKRHSFLWPENMLRVL